MRTHVQKIIPNRRGRRPARPGEHPRRLRIDIGGRRSPSSSSGSGAGSRPEWRKYTVTIGDNGNDGSQELAKITGVFDNAPYKVTFACFTYGPPLLQAAASGDIDLGSGGDVPRSPAPPRSTAPRS
ncbi:hypothetical protein ACIRU3_44235 [Streptomyces sp. NPDC101151]|uniref:hypothetical protein n=1 Tax=Streptomyces sp. NPDC101151 TaxID=3366115 RepID=UPI00381B044D